MTQEQGMVEPTALAAVALPARRSTFQRVVRILVRKRLMTAALVVLLIMGLSSLFAGWIAPYSYVATEIGRAHV